MRSLLRRLSQDQPKYEQIIEDYRLREVGVLGEERMKKKLAELRLQIPYVLLQDVNLADGEWKTQIDFLLITDRVCLVLEAKNISGELYFDDKTEEFYRFNQEGNKKYFPNPHYQVLKNIRFMENWFLRHNIPLPVTGAAFMTAKNSRLVTKPPVYRVYKLETLIEKISAMLSHFSSPLLSYDDISHLKNTFSFIQEHFKPPPLCNYYKLHHSEIETGVICPSCGQLPMEWKMIWLCPFCGFKSRDAHHSAIKDYLTIVKPTITNKEFRQFCHVTSVYTASRMLRLKCLDAKNLTSGRVYTLKESE
ncbi:nuclease-related domain-containing protein [Chungangia koreensis]|uniref:Nuclease-related domain-containing protein n=2 Tax=Chungangia koreensis TaxID=752657 RepID=A0ABV8X4G1_9LACT